MRGKDMDEYMASIRCSEVQYLKKYDFKEKIILSVVIPTYKRERLLEEAVTSIAKNVLEYDAVEIIVLSNDPDDSMINLCKRYEDSPFSVIRNTENLGMCGNLNKCLFVAKGEYVAYLHDDDLLISNYIPQMLKAISENPDVDCIIPARYLLMGDSEWGNNMQKKQLVKHIASSILFLKKFKAKVPYRIRVEDIYRSGRNCFSAPTCGTTFRRESIVEAGGFPASWKYAFDFVFFEEFCREHKVLLLKEPLGIYRMVESASNDNIVQFEFFRAQKYALDKNKDLAIVKNLYYEYLHLFAMGLSTGAQKLIYNEYGNDMENWNKIKYIILRTKTELFYFSSGIESERYLSKKKKEKLFGGNL